MHTRLQDLFIYVLEAKLVKTETTTLTIIIYTVMTPVCVLNYLALT